jgi:CDP-diacylglycerol--glycerol-3-phosphate 3-phosphatidyltransferase
LRPFSIAFFLVYFLCGVSDVLDGYIARKIGVASRLGEALDSIADFVLIAVALIVFVPLLAWEPWMLWWIGAIALARLLSLGIGFAKYRALAFIHTYANKAAGTALFCFPLLYRAAGLTATACILCCIVGLSALEELLIVICSKELDRNTPSLFSSRRKEGKL